MRVQVTLRCCGLSAARRVSSGRVRALDTVALLVLGVRSVALVPHMDFGRHALHKFVPLDSGPLPSEGGLKACLATLSWASSLSNLGDYGEGKRV